MEGERHSSGAYCAPNRAAYELSDGERVACRSKVSAAIACNSRWSRIARRSTQLDITLLLAVVN